MAFQSLDIKRKQSTVIAKKRETKMVSPKGSPSLLPRENLLPGETVLPGESFQVAAQEERMHTKLSHLPELRVREGSLGDYGDSSLQGRLPEGRGKTSGDQHQCPWTSGAALITTCLLGDYWRTGKGPPEDGTISEVHTQSGTVS